MALAAQTKEKNSEEVILRNANSQKKQQVRNFILLLKLLFDSLHKFFSLLQEAVISELKHHTNAIREKKLLHQDDVYNGALEDILLGLKSEPYRRADSQLRRSQRRRIDSNRYSRNLDEEF